MGSPAENNGKLEAWLKSGDYMPSRLRDFHDQKDLFKCMHDFYSAAFRDPKNEQWGIPSWTGCQVYIVDFFLYFMAMHGYTLQRSRSDLPFYSLDESVGEFQDMQAETLKRFLASRSSAVSKEVQSNG